jgi:hypothetical protein
VGGGDALTSARLAGCEVGLAEAEAASQFGGLRAQARRCVENRKSDDQTARLRCAEPHLFSLRAHLQPRCSVRMLAALKAKPPPTRLGCPGACIERACVGSTARIHTQIPTAPTLRRYIAALFSQCEQHHPPHVQQVASHLSVQ